MLVQEEPVGSPEAPSIQEIHNYTELDTVKDLCYTDHKSEKSKVEVKVHTLP